jgi:hypothetical protein
MRLIKGTALTARQREQVLAAFVHRHTAIGDGRYYPTEQAWLADHAFYFVKDGSRLARNRRYAEPHSLAEPTGGGQP